MNNTSPYTISGIWTEKELSAIAELCIRSYLDNGISFQLFTYSPLHVPDGTSIRNAEEILPASLVCRYDADFKEFFRYTFLSKEGGFWSDLDMVCLSPYLPEQLPFFAEQKSGLIGTGFMGFPPGHPVMECLRALSEDSTLPMPWDTPEERLIKRKSLQEPIFTDNPHGKILQNSEEEIFTRALSHFNLLNLTAPFSAIYPISYDQKEKIFNGELNTESPDIETAHTMCLWTTKEIGSSENEGNIKKDSLAGELLARHLKIKNDDHIEKKKVRILVGICSCCVARPRRVAVRETWLSHPQLGIECKFFLGRYAPPHGEAEDTVALWVEDDYGHLPAKVLEFFRYALKHYDFEWLFKCDDDTYVALDRLEGLIQPEFDLVGDWFLDFRGAPSGGAGYLLSRSIVEKIVNCPDIPEVGAEDVVFGELVTKLGGKYHVSPRLSVYNSCYPLKENNMITAHWCTPNNLRSIENFYHSSPVTQYKGTHGSWQDDILFYKNGTFRRKEGCSGTFTHKPPHHLILHWFSWPEDHLVKGEEGYANDQLSLTKIAGCTELDSIIPSELRCVKSFSLDLNIRIGEDSLPPLSDWLNLKISKFDISRKLPWIENSVQAFYLPSIMENIHQKESHLLFQEIWRTLTPGGILRIPFIDIVHLSEKITPEYVKHLFPYEQDASHVRILQALIQKHGKKTIWTRDMLTLILSSTGFNISTSEWDESLNTSTQSLESQCFSKSEKWIPWEMSFMEAIKPLS